MAYPPQRHGIDQRPHPNSRPPPALTLRPTRSPSNDYTFRNLLAVSAHDIPPERDGSDTYLLLNDRFIFSARPHPNLPQGTFSSIGHLHLLFNAVMQGQYAGAAEFTLSSTCIEQARLLYRTDMR